MAFVLKKKDSVKKQVKAENGIELSLEYDGSLEFNTALAQVQESMGQKLTKDSLTGLNGYVALLFLIGEHLLKAWNVEDENGVLLECSGDNLALVCNNVEPEFVAWLIGHFTDMLNEYQAQASEIKKKR